MGHPCPGCARAGFSPQIPTASASRVWAAAAAAALAAAAAALAAAAAEGVVVVVVVGVVGVVVVAAAGEFCARNSTLGTNDPGGMLQAR